METPIDASIPQRVATQAERDNTKRTVSRATGLLMAGILLSRVLGFVRDRIIAHQFGQTVQTDIYNAAFTIPDLLFFLLAGGALSGAFIPVFAEYVSKDKEKDAWRIFSVVAVVMTSIFVVLSILGMIFTQQLVLWTNPGYAGSAYKLNETIRLTRVLLPAQVCFMLGGLMMGTLTARNLFAGQAWGPVIYNLGIIFGGLVLSGPFHLGVAGLCWGALIGAVIGNLLLQWILVRQSGGYFIYKNLRRYWKHPGVIKVGKLMIPVIFGLSLPYISLIIGKGFASSLGDGPQSALVNANRLMQVPLGLFAQAGAIAIFPTLSMQAANLAFDEMRHTLCYGLRSILFLTIPSSALMMVLALPIVQLLLQSGKFKSGDAALTASVLCWFAIGIFAWSAHSIITRGFYALQETHIPVIVGTVVSLIFIPLNYPLRAYFGINGLALATTIAATLHMVILTYLLRKRLNGLEDRILLIAVFKIVVASGVTAFVCYALRVICENVLPWGIPVWARSGATLTICLSASTLLYGGIALAWRMEEIRPIQLKLRKKLAKYIK